MIKLSITARSGENDESVNCSDQTNLVMAMPRGEFERGYFLSQLRTRKIYPKPVIYILTLCVCGGGEGFFMLC